MDAAVGRIDAAAAQRSLPAGVQAGIKSGVMLVRRRPDSDSRDLLVTADGLDALVYTEARCGDLCGQGSYNWLRRTGSAGPWSIMKTIVSWVS